MALAALSAASGQPEALPEIARRVEIRLGKNQHSGQLERALSGIAKARGLKAPAFRVRDHVRRLDVELVGRPDDVGDLVEAVIGPEAKIMRDEVLPPPGAPADPVYPDRGGLRRTAAPVDPGEAAMAGSVAASETVIVAIVDSGIMTAHPDLRHRLVRGLSVLGGDVEDEDGHGTLLAGTVLAVANRSPAIRLMPVKFIDGRTRPDSERAAQAIDEMMKQHPRPHIIDLSFELGVESRALRDAIERAGQQHVLVVIAAGNSGADNDAYPAFPACYGHATCQALPDGGLPNVITVMATDRFDDRPGFSNYGDTSVHIAAPGVGIVSTHSYLTRAGVSGDRLRYQRYDGTSAAAAYVAGAAARLKSVRPRLLPEELIAYLIEAADSRPDLRCQAKGRLNVARALAAVRAIPGGQPG